MSSYRTHIIRDALARALFDAGQDLFDGFRWTALAGRPPPCDAAKMLANRIAHELAREGYYLKRDRYNARPDPIRARLALHDHLVFGIEATPREFREALDSPERSKAMQARTVMTERIAEGFNFMKVTLAKRQRS